MRATAWLATVATVGLLATGCGSQTLQPGPAAGSAGRPGSAGETAARRDATGPATLTRAQADRLAASLLRRAVAPAGARADTGRLPGAISQAPSGSIGSPAADIHRAWSVTGQASDVFTIICEHPPAGMVGAGSDSSAGRTGTTEQSVSYRLAHLPAGVYQATLSLAVAPGAAGRSVVRADAQVVWYPPRPADEHIPASLHAVRISETSNLALPGKVPGGQNRSRTVTTPGVVRHLAALLNGARVSPAGAIPCPLGAITYQLAFAASATAKAAVVAVDPGCPGVEMTVNGQTRPILVPPPGLIAAVTGLLGGVRGK